MDKEKLHETLVKHKRWLGRLPGGEKADLQDTDLQDADLQGADLQGADLRRADLQDADLQGANLRRADLQDTDLQDTDLQDADLQGADLRRADLQDADLQGANLRRADLQDTDLQGADLRRADLRHADLQGANLDYSCWPLWCGSLDVKVDACIARQLAYHFCRLDCDDPEYQAAREAIRDFANKFHRVEECGKIEDETDIFPFGKCENCSYEFNSELVNEYNIKYCPNCGMKVKSEQK